MEGYLGLIRDYIIYWIRLITAHPLLKEFHRGFYWTSRKNVLFSLFAFKERLSPSALLFPLFNF